MRKLRSSSLVRGPWRTLGGLLIASLFVAPLARAAETAPREQVIALQKSVAALSLYAKPYDKATGVLAAREVPFPLPILEVDGDFLKVRLADKEVWLDGAEVTIDKPVDFACAKEVRKPTKTASVQGASTGCK